MSLTDDFVRVPAMEYAALMARLAEAEALLREAHEYMTDQPYELQCRIDAFLATDSAFHRESERE